MERMLARLGGDPEYDTREFSPLGEVSLRPQCMAVLPFYKFGFN